MKTKKIVIFTILLLLITVGVVGLVIHTQKFTDKNDSNTQNTYLNKPPESYSVSQNSSTKTEIKVDDFKNYSNKELGIELQYKNNVIETKTLDQSDPNNTYKLKNVIEFLNPLNSEYKNFLLLTPVDATSSSGSLNLLEKYIISYVGTILKTDQKVLKIKNFEVALIGYVLDKSEGIFSIFAGIKNGNAGYILELPIDNYGQYLEVFNNVNKNDSLKVVNSINLLNNYDLTKFNIIKKTELESLNRYKESNSSKFPSTLY